jgi:D-glycero-D-manno-heptose 1,7-bisphosphate phosphatase/D-glycero-alpha-D-manno-heptose 1-phosphate guanylyltransferase
MLNLKDIDNSWTLFLDRDGVLNVEKKDHYVLNPSEFIFLERVHEALKILSEIFGLILVASNQRGVAKQLMTLEDLQNVHAYMMQEIVQQKGRIDKIYFCTDLDNSSPNRKPNPGMALQAKKDFPQIDFSKSIMAGNKLSDMQFARNAGMHGVFIASTNPEIVLPHELIDARFNSLFEFATTIHQ